jgi:lipopolysaccharide transport system permease protein
VLGLILLLTCAVGGWLAAVNVKYRDVRYVVPFFMQIWFFATPVIYPASLVPPQWRVLLALNPMVGFIDAFRAACFGRPFDWVTLAIATAVTFALLTLAIRTFRSIEQTFADYI